MNLPKYKGSQGLQLMTPWQSFSFLLFFAVLDPNSCILLRFWLCISSDITIFRAGNILRILVT